MDYQKCNWELRIANWFLRAFRFTRQILLINLVQALARMIYRKKRKRQDSFWGNLIIKSGDWRYFNKQFFVSGLYV